LAKAPNGPELWAVVLSDFDETLVYEVLSVADPFAF